MNTWDRFPNPEKRRLMTAEQISYWATQGIEFGSHSRSHRDLRVLSGEELAREVAGSREELESLLGSAVISFAYPYGYYDEKVRDCVRGAFEMAFTTEGGLNDLRTDLHRLRRPRTATGNSLDALGWYVRWGWSPWHPVLRIRAALRLRSRLRNAASLLSGRSG